MVGLVKIKTVVLVCTFATGINSIIRFNMRGKNFCFDTKLLNMLMRKILGRLLRITQLTEIFLQMPGSRSQLLKCKISFSFKYVHVGYSIIVPSTNIFRVNMTVAAIFVCSIHPITKKVINEMAV